MFELLRNPVLMIRLMNQVYQKGITTSQKAFLENKDVAKEKMLISFDLVLPERQRKEKESLKRHIRLETQEQLKYLYTDPQEICQNQMMVMAQIINSLNEENQELGQILDN